MAVARQQKIIAQNTTGSEQRHNILEEICELRKVFRSIMTLPCFDDTVAVERHETIIHQNIGSFGQREKIFTEICELRKDLRSIGMQISPIPVPLTIGHEKLSPLGTQELRPAEQEEVRLEQPLGGTTGHLASGYGGAPGLHQNPQWQQLNCRAYYIRAILW